MIRKVMALDPGGTTGWATWTSSLEAGMPHSKSEFACGQLGPEEHHRELYNLLGSQQTMDFTLIAERFEFRNDYRAGLNLMSREYIGVTKHFVQERMGEPLTSQTFVLQTAAQAKGFVTDRHIRSLDLWSPSAKHAMDAIRHLLFYLITSEPYKTSSIRQWVLQQAYGK